MLQLQQRTTIPFGWKDRGRQRDGQIYPGQFHLLTHGDLNTPRWLQTFDEVSLVLDRQFVADVVRDGLPADRIEFATQRSADDATILSYTDAFRRELASPATEFAGKRVFITGGTRGVGEAIVRRFATAGATVGTTARSPLAGGSCRIGRIPRIGASFVHHWKRVHH